MDIENLDDEEVKKLIDRLKQPKNIISFDQAYQKVSTLFGKIDIVEPIIDSDNDIDYFLKVYQGRLEKDRFSIHLRFKEQHHHLVRIDANPGNNHINPDGEKIVGSHIHIYSNKHTKKDAIAIPLEISDFPNVNTILDAFIEFLTYTNIEQKGVGT